MVSGAATLGVIAAALGAVALIGRSLPQSGLGPVHSLLTDAGVAALLGGGGIALAATTAKLLSVKRSNPSDTTIENLEKRYHSLQNKIQQAKKNEHWEARAFASGCVPELCLLAGRYGELRKKQEAQKILQIAEECAQRLASTYGSNLAKISQAYSKLGEPTEVERIGKILVDH